MQAYVQSSLAVLLITLQIEKMDIKETRE